MKAILGILLFISAQSAHARITVAEARAAACELAVRLGWNVQVSCEEDFGQPFKTTNDSYVFKSRVLGPNCEARIIVSKHDGSATGYVDSCE